MEKNGAKSNSSIMKATKSRLKGTDPQRFAHCSSKTDALAICFQLQAGR